MISNCGDSYKCGEKLNSKPVYLYTAKEGRNWCYSHHPSIVYYKGKFHAIWSSGKLHEDFPSQRIMKSESEDFENWSEPYVFVDTISGKHSDIVLTACGFHQHEDMLVAYVSEFEYTPDNVVDGSCLATGTAHMDTMLYAYTTHDGINWSDKKSLNLKISPNHGPQKTDSGRLITAGHVAFPYTDDPRGLSGWKVSGIFPDECKIDLTDDGGTIKEMRKAAGWPTLLCEGSFYQTDDNVIHMLLRSGEFRLWHTKSTDNGLSWSSPEPTQFTDNNSKFHFGRLPDGRFYYVGNPNVTGPKRCPLVLSLSKDGDTFREHYIIADKEIEQRVPGRHKGGVYGYPHTMIHDGCMYVICSICKEDIVVFRVGLDF